MSFEQPINWENTRVALNDLLELCKCAKCNSVAEDPCSFHGECCHNFCRRCANALANKCSSCVECGVALWLKDLKPNHRLREAIPICKELQELLGSADDDTVNDEFQNSKLNDQAAERTPDISNQKQETMKDFIPSQNVDFVCDDINSDHTFQPKQPTNVICIDDDSQPIENEIDKSFENRNNHCEETEKECKKSLLDKSKSCLPDTASNKITFEDNSCNNIKTKNFDNDNKNDEINVEDNDDANLLDNDDSDGDIEGSKCKDMITTTKEDKHAQNQTKLKSDLNEPLSFAKNNIDKDTSCFAIPSNDVNKYSQFSNALSEKEINQGIQKNPSGFRLKPKKTYVKSKDSKDKQSGSSKRKKMFNPLLNNKLKEDIDSVFIFSSNPSISNQNENIEPPSLVKKRNLNRSKTPPSIDTAKDNNKETSAREILSKSSVKGLRNKSKNLSTTKNSSSKEKETTEQQKKRPKNLNKKNVRGETPLHVAAIKGNKKRVGELLSFGAEVNTKDHNGWTPLHEACSHGFCDIVEMLLDHGAILDCVGGEENDTPLHDAVSNRRVEVVQCLLARGAQTNIRNAQGYTAEEMALTSEFKTIFKEATFMNIGKANESINNVETSFVTTDAPTSDEEKIFVSSNLNNQELKIFKTSCEKMNIKVIKDFDQSATHLICGADEVNIARTRTLKYMFSLLTGKWIVNLQWLTESAKQGVWLNETDYEIIGTQDCNGDIPKKARLNRLKAFPKLFEGCSFYLRGSFSKLLSKDILRNLIKTGGGKILLREPKTDISDPLLTPISPAVNKLIKNKQGASRIFHAQENSAQVCCAEYIIYDPSLSKAKDIVSSPLLCTAPTTWLLNCVSSFSIIEINDLDMIENIQTSQ